MGQNFSKIAITLLAATKMMMLKKNKPRSKQAIKQCVHANAFGYKQKESTYVTLRGWPKQSLYTQHCFVAYPMIDVQYLI